MPESNSVLRLRFSIFAAAVQAGLIVLFIIFARYGEEANAGKNMPYKIMKANEHINTFYAGLIELSIYGFK